MGEDKKILLVGGGTGGHVTPLLAVAESLLERGANPGSIYLITDETSAKQDYISGYQINIKTIPGGKFHRFFTLRNLATPFLVVAGFFSSYFFLRKIKPEVVLAKGAYLSLPVIYAAKMLGIPVYLHESDSVMGATNRRLAPKAEKIFVSFPVDYYDKRIREKLVYTGLPIRKFFFRQSPVLSSEKGIVIWGGSQGAEGINERIIEKLEDYLMNFEVYHICGDKNFAKYDAIKKQLPDKLKDKHHLYGTVGREIFKIISTSDLVISRAGATSLFELAALGKATIIIPYPAAASDHQTKNAEFFAHKNAAIMVKESEVNAEELKKIIFNLMNNQQKREDLRQNISQLAPRDAGLKIADILLKRIP